MMDVLYVGVLLAMTECLLLMPAFSSEDHYTAYNGKMCNVRKDDNLLGTFTVGNVEECRGICDAHAQCVGFVFKSVYYGGINCWPVSVIGNTWYVGPNWTIYKRTEGHGGCTFDSTPGHALYGHNDELISTTNVDVCKRKCMVDNLCLSFDFNNKTCFLSWSSKDTEPSFYGQHYALTYFHKRCGTDVEAVSDAVVNARDGGFYSMKDGLCVRTFVPFATSTGNKFDDADMRSNNITEISVFHSYYIQIIHIKYGKTMRSYGTSYTSSYGMQSTLRLNEDEYITRVEGNIVLDNQLGKVLFITNQRTSGPFGSFEGTEFSVDGLGKRLLYISGFVSDFSLSIIFNFEC